MRGVSVVALLAACAPVPPFATLETAETLRSGEASVSAYGGAGGGKAGICCGGGGARVRYGVSDTSELGLDASVLTDGKVADFAGKVAVKHALAQWLALALGGGVTFGGVAYGRTAGGDVALIASTPGPDARLYASLRAVASAQLQSNIEPTSAEAAIATFGVAMPVARTVRVFVEAGVIAALQQSGQTPPTTTTDSEGFYVAAALAYTWAKP